MKKPKSANKLKYKHIPTELTKQQFDQFVLPFLSTGSRGPKCKVPLFNIFNYILKIIYTGMQWKQLPIQLDNKGRPRGKPGYVHQIAPSKKYYYFQQVNQL